MTEKFTAIETLREKADFLIALAGNPNVGKSTIFNNLTGLGVTTAHYPGKTVELNLGITRINDSIIGVVDLPGIYSLDSMSEDQYVARETLLENRFDALIVVLDATNLARNLYMLLQLIDMEYPVIAALNLVDEAGKHALEIDAKLLGELTGIRVFPTSAITGQGISELLHEATKMTCNEGRCVRKYHYGADIEKEIGIVESALEKTGTHIPSINSHRASALFLLEKDPQFLEMVRRENGEEIFNILQASWKRIEEAHGEEASLRIIRERHGIAGLIASRVTEKLKAKELFSNRLWRLSTDPVTGFPILIGIFALTMMILYKGGNLLSEILAGIWSRWCSPPISFLIAHITHDALIAKVLRWGFDDGMLAAISVGIPYVLIFYFLLSFLEDTGYLNSAAFLLDKAFHIVGLHGRAFIPLAAAFGCNVPAVIGTRVLGTLRERIIAIFLIVIVSCSARTAVIIGAVSRFLGWFWACVIFFIDILLAVVAGLLLHRFTGGESEGLLMEVFPFRFPHLKTVLQKTWTRFADFVWIATPIVMAGSLLLGYLYETNLIWMLSRPLSPIIEGWLGLPPFAGITLFFAVLRKELALQFLVTLAAAQHGHSIESLISVMSPEQIFTFTLFNSLYMPCLATITVIQREIGFRWAAVILGSTLAVSLILVGILHHLLIFFRVFG